MQTSWLALPKLHVYMHRPAAVANLTLTFSDASRMVHGIDFQIISPMLSYVYMAYGSYFPRGHVGLQPAGMLWKFALEMRWYVRKCIHVYIYYATLQLSMLPDGSITCHLPCNICN